ncbi:MAG TPA: cytochrome P450 [Acidimicrobiia bacterium]|nr:cytochrome P450 [Acidimicrobiia bacterium]
MIDLTDTGLYEHGFPDEVFARLRVEAPVYWQEFDGRVPDSVEPGAWVLSKHSDVQAVNRDDTRFSAIDGPLLAYVPEMRGVMLVSMDGEQHTRLRRLISAGFTPRMIGKLDDDCRKWAARLIDDALALGDIDFVSEIAYKLPMHMIADIVGIPESDRDWLFSMVNNLLLSVAPSSAMSKEDALGLQVELFEYAEQLGRSKREHPSDDVWTTLSTVDIDGDGLGEAELNFFFMLLTAAGSETTRNALAVGLATLAEHPDQLDRLRSDRSLLKSAVDEIIRWASPVSYFARRAVIDVEVRGVPIKAGDRVTLWYPSANRDDEVFAEPFTFDITRTPNPHVSFGGGGPHYCLGASLAKLEIAILLDELLRRSEAIEVLSPLVWQFLSVGNPVLVATKELRVRMS